MEAVDKQSNGEILQKIHAALRELSSSSHKPSPPSSPSNPSPPPIGNLSTRLPASTSQAQDNILTISASPHSGQLNFNCYGKHQYSRRRKVKRPDGTLAEESFKNARITEKERQQHQPHKTAPEAQVPASSQQIRDQIISMTEKPEQRTRRETSRAKRRSEHNPFSPQDTMSPYVPPHLRPEFLKRIANSSSAKSKKSVEATEPSNVDKSEDITNQDNNQASPGLGNSKWVPKIVQVISKPIEIPAVIHHQATSDNVDSCERMNIVTPKNSQISPETNFNVGSTPAMESEDSGTRSIPCLTNAETHVTTIAFSSHTDPLQVKPVLTAPSSDSRKLLTADKVIKMSEKLKHPVERLSVTVIKPPVMPDPDDGWGVPILEGNADQDKKKKKTKKSVTRKVPVECDDNKQSTGNKATKMKGWPKISRVKKTATTVTDDGGDSDNGGWGVQHNAYDPNAAAALMDWEGNWLPAPPHWEGRSSFTNTNFFADTATWIEHTEKAQGTIVSSNGSEIIIQKPALYIEHEAFTRPSLLVDTFAPLADIAPKYWLPDQIEGQSVQAFWSSFIQSEAPLTIEETEMPPTKPDWQQPYWTKYIDDNLPYIKTLEVPDYRLDPDDKFYEAAQTDQGSGLKCAAKMAQKELAKKNRKRARNAGFRRQHNQDYSARQSPNPHRPKINIYLRTARRNDLPQITDIYNYYVTNTVYVPERDVRTMAMMEDRLRTSIDENFSWIVAVLKNNAAGKAAGPCNGPAVMCDPQETVVGFGYTDDYVDRDSAYGYTADVELYVHPSYLHRGVGKSLMDRMVFLLDPGHKSYDAVEWCGSQPEHTVPGGARIIKNVIIKVPYASEEEHQRMKWMEVWLQSFGFNKVGTLNKIGVKHAKWVSVTTFQKRTGSSIDPKM